jgi:hypothetical protein
MRHYMARDYQHPQRYFASALSLAIARVACVATFAILALAVLYATDGPNGIVPNTALLWGSAALGGLWLLAVCISLVLALLLRCNDCGHLQIWLRNDLPAEYRSKHSRSAAVRWFYSDEFHDRRFICPYCFTEYSF